MKLFISILFVALFSLVSSDAFSQRRPMPPHKMHGKHYKHKKKGKHHVVHYKQPSRYYSRNTRVKYIPVPPRPNRHPLAIVLPPPPPRPPMPFGF